MKETTDALRERLDAGAAAVPPDFADVLARVAAHGDGLAAERWAELEDEASHVTDDADDRAALAGATAALRERGLDGKRRIG